MQNKEIKVGKKGIKQKRIKTLEKNIEKQEVRDEYFEYHISKCTHSEFSGTSISEPNRSNICHLLDKGRHPSVQSLKENCIYLQFKEHERFDKLLFSHEFEKIDVEFKNISDLIWKRFKFVLSLCLETTNFTRELEKYIDGRQFKSK